MARTLKQRLDDLDTAIQEIESGAQAASVEGFSYTRANISWLYKQQAKLQKQYDRERGKRPAIKTASFGGMGY